MAWTKYQLVLAVVMVITGTLNTLTTKWADHLEAKGRDGKRRPFSHPFFQAFFMFLGEFCCYIVFKVMYFIYRKREVQPDLLKGNQNFNPFIFLLPAMCDMVATSVMYVGLNLTYASSFQMFRGAVIIFVALLSLFFLRRKIFLVQWLGIILVIIGLVVVGTCDFMSANSGASESHTSTEIITGDLLIFGAQIVTAAQMVIEEKFVSGKDIPALQAVGWEGLFGCIVLAIILIPFYFIHAPKQFADNPREVLEDVVDAFYQLGDNKLLVLALVGTIVSIAFFNFAGISVTKELSATTRMVLDSARTLFIWLITIGIGWQTFYPLQILGFALLLLGGGIYNRLLPSFSSMKTCCRKDQESAVIITNED